MLDQYTTQQLEQELNRRYEQEKEVAAKMLTSAEKKAHREKQLDETYKKVIHDLQLIPKARQILQNYYQAENDYYQAKNELSQLVKDNHQKIDQTLNYVFSQAYNKKVNVEWHILAPYNVWDNNLEVSIYIPELQFGADDYYLDLTRLDDPNYPQELIQYESR